MLVPDARTLVSLDRLAMDTGGRYTERTNDLTLAYARAQRDLTCIYSLGFYDKRPKEDRVREVSVRVRCPGMRAIHPSKYMFRSKSARRESMIRTAFVSPERFESGVVRAHIFPLRPSSKKFWDGMLAVSFPVPLAETKGRTAQRDFGAVLSKGPVVLHSFNRRIRLRPREPAASAEPWIVFLEPVNLAAGRYTLTVVMTDPEQRGDPHTAKVEVTVPKVPKGELFLVGPMLGRSAKSNLVVISQGSMPADDEVGGGSTFEPLLVQQLDGPFDVFALTQACLVGSPKRIEAGPAIEGSAISRSLLSGTGEMVGTLPEVSLALESSGKIHCQNLVDMLPTSSLTSGEYVFEASLRPGEGEDGPHKVMRFAVAAP